MPVVNKLVKEFKNPPESRAKEKKFTKEIWFVEHQAMPGSFIRDAVDDHDVPEPQKWESVLLPRLKPCKSIPG